MHRPRNRFGQHFLKDAGVVARILDAIDPTPDDVFVEIGPGPGALTHELATRCGHLHVVELDRDLAAALLSRYGDDPRVSVHQGDALAFDIGGLRQDPPGSGLRIAGNLPYNISTPLLFHLLEARRAIADMHFMLQKEVVERMAADPGSRRYGRLGIMLGCCFDIEPLFDVPQGAFAPPPRVVSTVVRLRPLGRDEHAVRDMPLMSRLVAGAFTQRRKTLRNALREFADSAVLEALGIDPSLRPENVAIADWVRLANTLARETDGSMGTR